jgi:hypothetical protein
VKTSNIATHFDRKLRGKRTLENISVSGRIILKWILEQEVVKVWSEFNCLRKTSVQ